MISDFHPPSGGAVEVLVSTLSRELVRRDHGVSVTTLATRDLPPAEGYAGVRVHRIPFLPVKRRKGPALVMRLHHFTLSCPKES